MILKASFVTKLGKSSRNLEKTQVVFENKDSTSDMVTFCFFERRISRKI